MTDLPTHILIVEDDPLLADGVAQLLRGAGYTADYVGSAEQAESALAAESFDLLVLDIGLPGMDGLELIRTLQQRVVQLGIDVFMECTVTKLLTEEDEAEGHHHAHDSLFGAVKTILLADVVMSLDNTLAIAGIAKGDWTLLITGLVLSIPLIVFGSTIIMKMIDRFPIIVYAGAGLIAYTAGHMIDADKAVQPFLPSFLHGTPYLAIILTVAVIGYGWWFNKKKHRTAHDVLVADEHAAERIEDAID